jgi:glycosyltransferase involved in cell wall biosynthesis
MVPQLSAIIIARDEARNIGACLDALAFCGERIVVENDSSDDTAKIAAEHGARVVSHVWEGFGPQKNHALSLARGEWVLSIDADERVSPALAQEIATAIASPKADAYEIPRISSFLGRNMGRSGLSTGYVLRLFRRGTARFTDDLVHERVVADGPVARLAAPLQHDAVNRLEEAIGRINRYSTESARMLAASGRRVTFTSGITHGLWTFIRVYLLRGGFLDGKEGFLLAVANAEGSYYRYMKAWLAGRSK